MKANSYEHDEYGITTEDDERISKMQEKRLLKEKSLIENIKRNKKAVKVYGEGETVFITWESTKGAILEVAEKLGYKVVQPLMLNPFSYERIKDELKNAKKNN